MRGHTLARAMKLVFATGWSGAWVILGLWLLENCSLILAVGPISAGLFVLMAFVADDLVPGASQAVTGFMKLTVALVFFGWAPLAFWSLWTNTPI
jgi:hypothetical protein